MFFKELILISLQGYLELLITAILNLRAPLLTTNGEVMAIAISYQSIALTLVFLPAVAIYALVLPKEKIESQEFE